MEVAFWLATLLPFVLVPTYLTLASQIAITAIFAVSLDLIMGTPGWSRSVTRRISVSAPTPPD